jgi:hypothetical protein
MQDSRLPLIGEMLALSLLLKIKANVDHVGHLLLQLLIKPIKFKIEINQTPST